MKIILKNMLFISTMDDLLDLKETKGVPACVVLIIQALLHDKEIGSLDTVCSILDFIGMRDLGLTEIAPKQGGK
jgi:hypothetical protein